MADRHDRTWEPIERSDRPSGEMQSRLSPPATPHTTHDLVLLAAAADRDPEPAVALAAAEQIARCAACATVAAELRAVAGGLADLPRTRTAPRDLRLTPEQASRLDRGRTWRQILRPFGSGGLRGLKPLAAALTTFGLAGLLLTVPFSLLAGVGLGAGGAAPVLAPAGNDTSGQAGGETDSRGPAVYPLATASLDAKGGASVEPVPGSLYAHEVGAAGASPAGRSAEVVPRLSDVAGPQVPQLVLISLGLTVAGLSLFAVLLVARRVT